ncbi:hypothetical protein CLU79DRAFT_834242 [Phycomyces nitens]|nr:hypothetical protein CLU79DRAFT_834242 [Phycomyces nitens]
MSDSLAASLQRFKQCTDTWKKLSEQGAQVLLAIQLEHIELLGESPEITVLLDNYKKLLDEMYQEYDRAVQINQSLKTEINGQATIDILSKQLAMYDEEYMLKVILNDFQQSSLDLL